MPKLTALDLPQGEPAEMLAALRRARSGDRLALHLWLVWAAGCPPTHIAAVLFGSRSSV